jgi:hypothetical protein
VRLDHSSIVRPRRPQRKMAGPAMSTCPSSERGLSPSARLTDRHPCGLAAGSLDAQRFSGSRFSGSAVTLSSPAVSGPRGVSGA